MPPAPAIVALSVDPAAHEALVTATLALLVNGEPLSFALSIPADPTTTEAMLPVLHGMSSAFAERGAARVEAEGKTVSCRAGCGACCRQFVPVAAAEARQLAALVAALPEPRQSQVRARFDAAVAALDAAGMLPRIDDPTAAGPGMGLEYFRLGIACPFLEDESCSIHPDRPLACREYLVTSPREHCAAPSAEGIAMVPVAWHLSRSLIKAERAEGWTALVLALRHADRATPPAPRPGPDILGAIVETQRD